MNLQLLSSSSSSTAHASSANSSQISTSDMCKIQVDLGLSSRQTIRLASHLRTTTKNRNFIEPHLKTVLVDNNRCLSDFFAIEDAEFRTGKGDGSCVTRTIAYCNDLKNLTEYICEARNLDLTDPSICIKIGIDGGGGFLKVCLNIYSCDDFECAAGDGKRSCYSDGIAPKLFKNTSVKKLFILAIAPDVEENYWNVLHVWILLQLKQMPQIHGTGVGRCLSVG